MCIDRVNKVRQLDERIKRIENTIRLFHELGANAIEVEYLTPELIEHFKQHGFTVLESVENKNAYVIDWS